MLVLVFLLVSGAYSTAGGFSTADLLAAVAILVTIFGLLLSTIGVLVLRNFTTTDDRLVELRTDFRHDVDELRGEMRQSIRSLWRALRDTPPPPHERESR